MLAHPNVHLMWEEPEPLVYGVQRGVFRRVPRGRGQALGVKFRPGAFRPFTSGPVAALADRAVPAAGIFGPEAAALGGRILALDDLGEMAAPADRFLLDRLPERPDPRVARVAALVDRITARPQLFRVDALAEELDLPVRRLQRLFAEYVGASPGVPHAEGQGRVLRRARLHEAAARADEGTDVDWPALAADLGYADQSHFIRDFTGSVGAPPTRYTAP